MIDIALDVQLPRQLRAVGHLRRTVRSLCVEMGVASDDVDALVLATSEACNNIILHADLDDTFEGRFRLRGHTARIEVVNENTPFLDLEQQATDPLSESGRGLQIMRHLCDEARFTTSGEGGTLVEMVRRVQATEGSLLDGPG